MHPDISGKLMKLVDIFIETSNVDGLRTVALICSELVLDGIVDANKNEYYSYLDIQEYAANMADALEGDASACDALNKFERPIPQDVSDLEEKVD